MCAKQTVGPSIGKTDNITTLRIVTNNTPQFCQGGMTWNDLHFLG